MKINPIKLINCCLFFITSLLSLYSFSMVNDEEPDPQLVKYYADLMDDKTELNFSTKYLRNKETIAIAKALEANKTRDIFAKEVFASINGNDCS
jgi:hypothetical protein